MTNNRFENYAYASPSYNSSECDAISFTVNKAIFLMGVQMFGKKDSTYEIILNILNGGEIISSLSSSCTCELVDCGYYGFTAKLDEPVRLKPNALYTIQALIKGIRFYRGTGGKEVIRNDDDLKITFKDSERYNNGTTVKQGQFPKLLIQF